MLAILAKIAVGAASAGGGEGSPDAAKGGKTGAGTIAKGILLSQAMLSVLKNSSRIMQEMSGQMKASFNLIKKSIGLILKPIGDVIGMILRPFAIGMMRFALPFYKRWLKSDVMKTIMGTGQTDNPVTALGVVGAKMGAGGTAGATAGGFMGGPIGAIIGGVIGAIAAVLSDAWQGIMNIFTVAGAWWEWLTQQLDNFFGSIGINMNAVRQAIAVFMLETIPAWWNAAVEGVIAAWNWLVEFFSVTVPEWVKAGWDGLVEFFTVTVPGWITSGWNTLVEFFTVTVPGWITLGFNTLITLLTVTLPSWFLLGLEVVHTFVTETIPKWFTDGWASIKTFIVTTIPGWFQSMIDAIKRMISRISGGLLGGGGKAAGGPIHQSGLYNLHAGEFVMRAGQVQDKKQDNKPIIFQPNITVNANVASGMDIRMLANELAKYQEIELRRRVSF